MSQKKIPFIFLFTICTIGYAQIADLSPLSKVSVLTCGSGEELYSTFGHSAFRIQDPTLGIDIIYNYGLFDFRAKNFYLNFAKGKMDYLLGRQRYANFLAEYRHENRWVKEQVLVLDLDKKNTLFHFLENNALPDNRVYQYDFFYDNCATKIWEVLKESFGKELTFDPNFIANQYTHRELIHQNLRMNSWSAFGIDLALGSVIDDIATPKEHLFLPKYIMKQIEHAKLGTKPLADKKITLFEPTTEPTTTNFLLTPMFWAMLLPIVTAVITFFDFKKYRRTRGLDFALFSITGLVGLLLCFLWFLTDHTATAGNFNLLWAFPINLIVAFILIRKKPQPKWLKKYMLLVSGLLVFTILVGVFKIQVFSPILFFIVVALGIRFAFLFLHQGKEEQTDNA